jgi:hypothetical protein
MPGITSPPCNPRFGAVFHAGPVCDKIRARTQGPKGGRGVIGRHGMVGAAAEEMQ